jgi:hypothetical protein
MARMMLGVKISPPPRYVAISSHQGKIKSAQNDSNDSQIQRVGQIRTDAVCPFDTTPNGPRQMTPDHDDQSVLCRRHLTEMLVYHALVSSHLMVVACVLASKIALPASPLRDPYGL